jgi:plastocyanin
MQEGNPPMPGTPRHVWIVLAGLCLTAPAGAGVLRGVVRVPTLLPAATPPAEDYPGHAAAMPGMHMPVRGQVSDAVVYVERVPAEVDSALAVAAAAAPRPQLAQKNQSFVPRVVPIAVGSAIDFPNLDPIYHNVFSLSKPRRFDLGKYPRGQSKTVVFNRTGQINVYCDIHSEMEAFILVLPHHAFTQPRPDGSFELAALPPGHYTLHVWHPDFHEIERQVDVPPDGDLAVDLSL